MTDERALVLLKAERTVTARQDWTLPGLEPLLDGLLEWQKIRTPPETADRRRR